MRILHVVPSYIPAYRYGGPILSVHDLNRSLVRAGADVTVFTTNIDGPGRLAVPTDKEVDIDGVKVRYFPVSFPSRWIYSSAMRDALRERVREFDVVHITSVFLAASTLGARAARRAGIPYIISPRGSLMREPLAMKSAGLKKAYLALVERRNLAGATAIHFTVESEEREYRAAGLPLRRSFVIPNGFDPAAFDVPASGEAFRKKWDIAPEDRVVLSMGRVNWKKGFDTLIPAFARVLEEDPRVFLVIHGTDEAGYRSVVEGLVKEHGVGERVRFTGAFEGAAIDALAASSCFVLPSYSENFGNAILQAMYCRLPVVLTPAVGLAEAVERAGAGLVVPKDSREVARAILGILKDSAGAKAMGERGRTAVLKDFAPAEVAKRFLAEYNTLTP